MAPRAAPSRSRARALLLAAALALALALSAPLAPQDAVVAHFWGAACPAGWLPHAASQGRLVLAVATTAEAGKAVGAPLGDGQDVAHAHDTSLVAPNPGFASAGCPRVGSGGNADLMTPGQLSAPLVTSDVAGTGLPLLQLLTCVMDVADPLNAGFALPADLFVFFDTATTGECPSSFNSLPAGYSGRLFSPFAATGSVGTLSAAAPVAVGDALVNAHAHAASATFTGGSYEAECGGSGGDTLSPLGPWPALCTTTEVAAAPPYLSLLSCVSNVEGPGAATPPGMLAFTTRSNCPSGWTPAPLSAAQQGSFVVSTPAGGVSGTSIGVGMALGDSAFAPTHTHASAAPAPFYAHTDQLQGSFIWTKASFADAQPISSSVPALAQASLALPYVQMRLCLGPSLTATASATASASATSTATATASASATASATATASASASATATAVPTFTATTSAASSATASASATSSSSATASRSVSPSPSSTTTLTANFTAPAAAAAPSAGAGAGLSVAHGLGLGLPAALLVAAAAARALCWEDAKRCVCPLLRRVGGAQAPRLGERPELMPFLGEGYVGWSGPAGPAGRAPSGAPLLPPGDAPYATAPEG